MPKKTKDTKGEAKGLQGKGKANGQVKLPASYAKKFRGDFCDSTPIRPRPTTPRSCRSKPMAASRTSSSSRSPRGRPRPR